MLKTPSGFYQRVADIIQEGILLKMQPLRGVEKEKERERIFARGIGREEGGEAIRKNLEVDSNRIIPRVFTLVMSSSLYRISSTRIKLRDLNDNRLISYYFA